MDTTDKKSLAEFFTNPNLNLIENPIFVNCMNRSKNLLGSLFGRAVDAFKLSSSQIETKETIVAWSDFMETVQEVNYSDEIYDEINILKNNLWYFLALEKKDCNYV